MYVTVANFCQFKDLILLMSVIRIARMNSTFTKRVLKCVWPAFSTSANTQCFAFRIEVPTRGSWLRNLDIFYSTKYRETLS